jgi:4-alpha-glucanotransferase
MNEALRRLAAAAGIIDGYWDGLGIRRELNESTTRALLQGLEFDPARDPQAHLSELADAPFMTPLPSSLVLRLGMPLAVTLAISSADLDRAMQWEILFEDGTARQGDFLAAQLAPIDARDIGGCHYVRVSLPLPAELPCGYHRLRLPQLDCSALLIVAPPRCFIPTELEHGRRCWGLAIQLYALRSRRNWGIGDFSDLAALAAAAGRAGAAFIGINPLHARRLAQPDEASPYAPSSREFLDPIYIDVEAVDEFSSCSEARTSIAAPEFQARLAALRAAPLVDYAGVSTLKLYLLGQLFRHFLQHGRPDRLDEFHQFRLSRGEPLAHYAGCEALASIGEDLGARREFLAYLQWLATSQLQAAAKAGSDAGMSIGLYCDLAVGAAHDGAEVSGEPQLFAQGMSVGAPPDMLNRQGQNWGLPPWNPRRLAELNYLPLRRLLAANMRNAGALRIDHVMALTRLFWIPQGMSGADGGYVSYPFEALAAIVALESERNQCMVIGEDLGSVPEGFREALHQRGFLSYRVLIYERHWQGDGRFCRPEEYPRQALAMVATHDMPTLHEFWNGGDAARREALGLYPEAWQRGEDEKRRMAERSGLSQLLADIGLPADSNHPGDVVAALHVAIARSNSMLAAAQLDDVIGETEPVNIPGTWREYPNWRRKLSLPIEEILADARWARLAAGMREAGRG